MYLTIIKITATVLAFIMGTFNIPFDIPGFSDEKITETTVEFLNDEAGSADAVITVWYIVQQKRQGFLLVAFVIKIQVNQTMLEIVISQFMLCLIFILCQLIYP